MVEKKSWQLEIEEYLEKCQHGQVERSQAWRTAIDLQCLEGLKPSDYLLSMAREHIDGRLKIEAVQRRLQSYYGERNNCDAEERDTREADIVSIQIIKMLSERTFEFSVEEWMSIHRRLFEGVYDDAGKIRSCNITENEWVLNGNTLLYEPYESIKGALHYEFHREKKFSYRSAPVLEAIQHIAEFTARIFRIHPFYKGNTRATALFIIKYLKMIAFEVNNEVFTSGSLYFRNALVRANYNDLKNGVHATTEYLNLFFENLLLDREHELKNSSLHIDYGMKQRKDYFRSSCQDYLYEQDDECPCNLEETAVLKILLNNPSISHKEMAERIGRSDRTVKRKIMQLREKGYVMRINGKQSGDWRVMVRW